MIERTLTETIVSNIREGFISVIYGPRRVGKTVLLNQILDRFPDKNIRVFNGDTQETRDELSTTSLTQLSRFAEGCDILAIDEAQRIPNIALVLKILIDAFPEKMIIATGSSSLELSHGLQETLTGRTLTYRLYPFSISEISQGETISKAPYLLEEHMVYGGYPYLRHLGKNDDKKKYLTSIVEDYLLKDIFELEKVRHRDIVVKLARLLAYQVGSEVSLNELAQKLAVDIKTVDRYVTLLVKAFVIIPVGAYSSNQRNEVVSSKKYYFFDLGIRNALTQQFHPLDSRTDIGSLWENYLILERLKKIEYSCTSLEFYFWRNYAKAEVDWIEIHEGKMKAFEFKWREKKARTPKYFFDLYGVPVERVHRSNFLDFVC